MFMRVLPSRKLFLVALSLSLLAHSAHVAAARNIIRDLTPAKPNFFSFAEIGTLADTTKQGHALSIS